MIVTNIFPQQRYTIEIFMNSLLRILLLVQLIATAIREILSVNAASLN